MSQRTFKLTGKEINEAIEEIREYFTNCKVDEKDVLRLSLLLEEALLRYRDKFGENLDVLMRTSRFSNKVTFKIRADKYNPLIEDEENNILSSEFVCQFYVPWSINMKKFAIFKNNLPSYTFP